jgi:hypothetical protein
MGMDLEAQALLYWTMKKGKLYFQDWQMEVLALVG